MSASPTATHGRRVSSGSVWLSVHSSSSSSCMRSDALSTARRSAACERDAAASASSPTPRSRAQVGRLDRERVDRPPPPRRAVRRVDERERRRAERARPRALRAARQVAQEALVQRRRAAPVAVLGAAPRVALEGARGRARRVDPRGAVVAAVGVVEPRRRVRAVERARRERVAADAPVRAQVDAIVADAKVVEESLAESTAQLARTHADASQLSRTNPEHVVKAQGMLAQLDGDFRTTAKPGLAERHRALRESADCAKTIGLMYGQHEADINEWLAGVRWASSTDVSHQTLTQVMRALVDAAILTENELLPPSALVSALSRDADPDANAV